MKVNTTNRLLDALPCADREALLLRSELVSLPVRQLLYRSNEVPRYAHFLTSGIASIVVVLSDGHCTEVGLVGSDGIVEACHLLGSARVPTESLVQVEGSALRVPFADLQRAFLASEPLRDLVLGHIQQQGLIADQLAACNYFHQLQPRLARWLLMIADRVHAPRFHLTQEFLAAMIGVRRTTVTVAAGHLQQRGLIRYSRGEVEILDWPGLEQCACECYRVVRDLWGVASR